LAVPGNHDLRRPDASGGTVVSLTELYQLPDAKKKMIWTAIVDDPNSDYRKAIDAAFGDYSQWWASRADEAKRGLKLFRQGLLPGEFAATLEKDGCHFGVIGLNTTFLQLEGGDFLGKLETHVQQYNRLMPEDDVLWPQKMDAAILVTHQPPDWLSPGNRQNSFDPLIAKAGRFAGHLCGHMHVAKSQTVISGGFPERRLLQGPSLLALEDTEDGLERLLGYQTLRIRVDRKSEIGNVRCWPRKAMTRTQANSWRFNIEPTYDLEEDGGTSEKRGYFSRPNWKESRSRNREAEPLFLVKPLELQTDAARAAEIGRQAAFRDEDVFFEGPEGSGKTIALTEFLAKSTELGKKTVYVTFMEYDEELKGGAALWQGIAASIYRNLKAVKELAAPGENVGYQDLTTYLFEKVLPTAYPLVIGFDEVGRLRQRALEEPFYRILRVWRDKDRYYFGDQSRLRFVLAGIERLKELPDKGDEGSRVVRLRDIPTSMLLKNWPPD
jgi:hypothetical protein